MTFLRPRKYKEALGALEYFLTDIVKLDISLYPLSHLIHPVPPSKYYFVLSNLEVFQSDTLYKGLLVILNRLLTIVRFNSFLVIKVIEHYKSLKFHSSLAVN